MLDSNTQATGMGMGNIDAQDGYRRTYRDLKRKVAEMEQENDALTLKLTKAKNAIQRLKLEKNYCADLVNSPSMLFQRYKQTLPSDAYRSDGSFSDSESRPLYGRSAAGSRSEDEEVYHKGQLTRAAQPPQPPPPAVLSSPNPPPHEKKPKKAKADPNLPKKPANAFFVYCEMHRGEIKDEEGGFSLGEATRVLGQRWKTLGKESKQKYFDLYEESKARYEREMITYNAATQPGATSSASRTPQHQPPQPAPPPSVPTATPATSPPHTSPSPPKGSGESSSSADRRVVEEYSEDEEGNIVVKSVYYEADGAVAGVEKNERSGAVKWTSDEEEWEGSGREERSAVVGRVGGKGVLGRVGGKGAMDMAPRSLADMDGVGSEDGEDEIMSEDR
ncbi:hypothetical protein BJ742DRAFT_742612 [Cladochytrium replicatum]|nr:hypothetical protein BJ742DRAFT_742612 [Cladochytrium replicatum]